MSALTTFAFNESLSIRIQNFDGSPWFVAKDIASCLEYTSSVLSNVSALFKNVPDKWKQIKPFETTGGVQNLLAVTEQGLYRFLMRSDKPKAVPFQDWLSEDVIPAIRKQGAYISDKLTYEEALKIVESRNATLTPAQQHQIQIAVAARAQKTAHNYQTIYRALKNRFQVARYDQIPQSQFKEALRFIQNVDLRVPETSESTGEIFYYNARTLSEPELRALANLIYLRELGKPTFSQVYKGLRSLNSELAPRFYSLIAEGDFPVAALKDVLSRNQMDFTRPIR